MTEYAKYLYCKEWQDGKWSKAKVIFAIEKAIKKGWQGIFEPFEFQEKPEDKWIGGMT